MIEIKTKYLAIIVAVILIAILGYFLLPKSSTTGYTVLTTPSDHIKGSPNAPVTIIEYSDFQCPYCGRVQPTIDQILKTYEGKVKLVYKHFPLNFHQYAEKAAEASECAADQGNFWEYHDILYENQNALTVEDLKRYAKDLGLDTETFNRCLDSGVMAERVRDNFNEGQNNGVQGTPAFFINGQLISGAQPYSVFKQIIDSELEAS